MPDTQLDQLPETWEKRLKKDVKHYLKETGMLATTFGNKAIGNSRFWKHFLEGRTVTLQKADEIYAFMARTGFNFKR